MTTNTELIERLFRYVKIDTQSDEEASSQPTTAGQHDLAKLLYEELSEMGVEAHYDTEHCYVYAKLPGEEPAIGFVSHMDTSPACSGKNVNPRIIENYQGQNIVLGEIPAGGSAILRPSDFPELLSHIGEDLIVTGRQIRRRRDHEPLFLLHCPSGSAAPHDLRRLHAGRGSRAGHGEF